jgi:hypothetical protein
VFNAHPLSGSPSTNTETCGDTILDGSLSNHAKVDRQRDHTADQLARARRQLQHLRRWDRGRRAELEIGRIREKLGTGAELQLRRGATLPRSGHGSRYSAR